MSTKSTTTKSKVAKSTTAKPVAKEQAKKPSTTKTVNKESQKEEKSKTAIVKKPISFKNSVGFGLIQLGEVVVDEKLGKGEVKWKSGLPSRVYIAPHAKIQNCYNLKIARSEKSVGEFTITHMDGGVYKVSDDEKNYPKGMWRVRFVAARQSAPVADIFCEDENARDWLHRCSGKAVKEPEATKKENIAQAPKPCKVTDMLLKFAEKLDRDFNLVSVCDVNVRKYVEDYVEKELKGNKFDLEKACLEFNEFLSEDVEKNVVDTEKNTTEKKVAEKKVAEKKVAQKAPIKKDTINKVLTKTAATNLVKEGKKPSKSLVCKTTVISLKGKAREWGSNLDKGPADVVYIGRKINRGGWDLKASEFCNPYNVSNEIPRDEAMSKYREYITAKLMEDDALKSKLVSYKGKKLACWCSPEACHGDVLCDIIGKIEDGTFDKLKDIITEKETGKKPPTKNVTTKGEGRVIEQKSQKNPPKTASKKADKKADKTPKILEEEFKSWFEEKTEYKVADIRGILKDLGIPGITNNITKKAMKEIASKYVVASED